MKEATAVDQDLIVQALLLPLLLLLLLLLLVLLFLLLLSLLLLLVLSSCTCSKSGKKDRAGASDVVEMAEGLNGTTPAF